jgi:two-component system sensor histidine kinase EvgS
MMWQQGSFDVIFTDCNMPEMNGYQLAQAIRQQEEQEQRPPILLLGFTANALPDEKERCRAAGMDDCLFKPISLSGLRACLQQHMNGRDNKVAGEGDISYSLDELSFMEDEQLQQLLEHLLQGLQMIWSRCSPWCCWAMPPVLRVWRTRSRALPASSTPAS